MGVGGLAIESASRCCVLLLVRNLFSTQQREICAIVSFLNSQERDLCQENPELASVRSFASAVPLVYSDYTHHLGLWQIRHAV